MDNANNNPIDAELGWLAFQYIAGELSAAERESFEGRLAEDQAAREAVAAAVELSAACRGAFVAGLAMPTSATSRRSARHQTARQSARQMARRFAVLAAAVAACVAIAWLGQFRGGGSGPGLADRDGNDQGASAVGSESLWGPNGPQRAGRVQQLALVWADLGEQLSPDEPPIRDAANEPSELNSELNSSPPPAATPHDDDAELAAPDWLMAALDDDTNTDGHRDEG